MRYYHQGIRLLLGLVLALVSSSVAARATVSLAPVAQHTAAISSQDFLSLSATDFAWHSVSDVAATLPQSADEVRIPGGEYLLVSQPDVGGTEQSPGESDVVRHQGFRKALLILIACGGLVRFLTSPTYLRFITDALDPRAF
jgi:hypothetical protein